MKIEYEGWDGSKNNAAQWESRLQSSYVPRETIDRIVMDYFVVEGYQDAAEKLVKEGGRTSLSEFQNVDKAALATRNAARMAIQNGQVQEAIDLAKKVEPTIITWNVLLRFHLLQQKLIERIRAGNTAEAIKFAQEELAPCGEECPEFLEELQRTLTLLVFENEPDGTLSELMSFAQKQRTASELNSALLAFNQEKKDPMLPFLIKLIIWTEERLKEHGHCTCEIDIRTGALSEHSSTP
uniref:CTLH domain-containing protein n=1 Tax=Rhodosorus marinus TaxID=101924 RepID=A0A7S0BCE4_9RHOD|mmetsp:Transcript_10316/g.14923  ORF Transcript_10316/g.14923 Transcript_10316/m.14923 type:complete len:239 (+) Transcript_10316:175-891(+)